MYKSQELEVRNRKFSFGQDLLEKSPMDDILPFFSFRLSTFLNIQTLQGADLLK